MPLGNESWNEESPEYSNEPRSELADSSLRFLAFDGAPMLFLWYRLKSPKCKTKVLQFINNKIRVSGGIIMLLTLYLASTKTDTTKYYNKPLLFSHVKKQLFIFCIIFLYFQSASH